MKEIPRKEFYVLPMFDHSMYHGPPLSVDGLVTEETGKSYKGQQTGDMMSNDTWHEYRVPNSFGDDVEIINARVQEWIDKPRPEGVPDWEWEMNEERSAPDPYDMLDWLHFRGVIPAGDYMVEVSW